MNPDRNFNYFGENQIHHIIKKIVRKRKLQKGDKFVKGNFSKQKLTDGETIFKFINEFPNPILIQKLQQYFVTKGNHYIFENSSLNSHYQRREDAEKNFVQIKDFSIYEESIENQLSDFKENLSLKDKINNKIKEFEQKFSKREFVTKFINDLDQKENDFYKNMNDEEKKLKSNIEDLEKQISFVEEFKSKIEKFITDSQKDLILLRNVLSKANADSVYLSTFNRYKSDHSKDFFNKLVTEKTNLTKEITNNLKKVGFKIMPVFIISEKITSRIVNLLFEKEEIRDDNIAKVLNTYNKERNDNEFIISNTQKTLLTTLRLYINNKLIDDFINSENIDFSSFPKSRDFLRTHLKQEVLERSKNIINIKVKNVFNHN